VCASSPTARMLTQVCARHHRLLYTTVMLVSARHHTAQHPCLVLLRGFEIHLRHNQNSPYGPPPQCLLCTNRSGSLPPCSTPSFGTAGILLCRARTAQQARTDEATTSICFDDGSPAVPGVPCRQDPHLHPPYNTCVGIGT
jgi:hypothetical protein